MSVVSYCQAVALHVLVNSVQGIFIGNNVKQSKVKVHNIISRYKFSQEMFSHMKVSLDTQL